tara:strand:+ start:679 stop:1371 length:693 start_codon:yes stop_codon:yes gene_type:complete
MSEETITEYSTHNFSAVDDQIVQVAKRERARTFAFRLESAKYLVGYIALAAVLTAFLVIMFSWAYRIITEPHKSEVVKVVRPEVVEREVIRIVKVPVIKSQSEIDAGAALSTSYDGPEVISEDLSVSGGNIVTNYNVFKQRSSDAFSSYGVREIVTGWRYQSSDQVYPESQYCYAIKISNQSIVSQRFDLGIMESDGSYKSLVTKDLATDISIPRSMLTKMEGLCVWASI